MKLNREKVAAALALLIFLYGMYSLVHSQLASSNRWRNIPKKLSPSYQPFLPVEPRLFLEDLSGNRNPFHFSTEWEPVPPEPLAPPAPVVEQLPRILFGWPSKRSRGQEILYRESAPKAVDSGGEDDSKNESTGGAGGTGGRVEGGGDS